MREVEVGKRLPNAVDDMTDIKLSRLLGELERDPSYAGALTRVRAARETAAQLRAMRKRAGLTQAELGKKLGVSQARISHVESGLLDYLPPIDFIYLYAEACGASITLHASARQEPKGRQPGALLVVINRRRLEAEILAANMIAHKAGMDGLAFDSVEAWLSEQDRHSPVAVIFSVGSQKLVEGSLRAELSKLVAAMGSVPVVVFADSDEPAEVLAALDAGARGYIPGDMQIQAAADAIDLVRAGGIFVPASSISALGEVIRAAATTIRPLSDVFTAREAAVAEAIRKGKANKVIAHELHLNETTVRVHVRNILKKLKATNRTEAIYKLNDLYPGSEPSRGQDKVYKPGLGN